MQVATRQLIDAGKRLDPASRALLNIWIQRGLDDEAIARLSGASAASLDDRRRTIVERLAAELGASATDVRDALDGLARSDDNDRPSADAPIPRRPTPVPDQPTRDVPQQPTRDVPQQPSTEVPQRSTRDKYGRRPMLAVLAVVVLAGIAILAALSSGANHRRAATSTRAARPSSPVSRTRPLVLLPGGPHGASGRTFLSGTTAHAQLRISVTGLPRLQRGHYEAWLYNSILDSVPLGRLASSRAVLDVELPSNHASYKYVDISVQPPGPNPNHSGESVLRAVTGGAR